MGSIFPNTQSAKTFAMGIPIHMPTGIAPRSSTTGIAAMSVITAVSARPKPQEMLPMRFVSDMEDDGALSGALMSLVGVSNCGAAIAGACAGTGVGGAA